MSGAKHTPGPWRINKRSQTAVEDLNSRGVCSTGGYADTFSNGAFHDESEANARLIASAPELLEALENLLAVKRGEGGTKPDAEQMAEAAIAKAKGETT